MRKFVNFSMLPQRKKFMALNNTCGFNKIIIKCSYIQLIFILKTEWPNG